MRRDFHSYYFYKNIIMENEISILSNVVNSVEILEKIGKPTLEALCKILKVQETSEDNICKKFKSKIIDIFETEGDAYIDYLSLKKFEILKIDEKKNMVNLFKELWDKYLQEKLKKNVQFSKIEIDKITPKFKNVEEMELFHLNLLKIYLESELFVNGKEKAVEKIKNCNEIDEQVKEKQRIQSVDLKISLKDLNGVEDGPNRMNNNFLMAENGMQNEQRLPMYPPMGMNPFNQHHPPFYMNFPFPFEHPEGNKSCQTKIEDEGNQNQMIRSMGQLGPCHQIMQSQYPEMNHPFMPPLPGFMPPYNFQFPPNYYMRNNQVQPQKKRGPKKKEYRAEELKKKKKTAPRQGNNYFSDILGKDETQFERFLFTNCLCFGIQNGESEYFCCSICEFAFHYSCLKIRQVPDIAIPERCPVCILSRDGLFTRSIGHPIRVCWYLHQKRSNQFRIETNQEEADKIMEAKKKGLECQIRFLKVDGKSLEKKKANTIFTEMEKMSKYSQITLPEMNSNCFGKYSIEIHLKQEEQDFQEVQVYMFILILIKEVDEDEIVREVFSNPERATPPSYTLKFQKEEKVRIKLQDPMTQAQIHYPVRGNRCDHEQVFDLKENLKVQKDILKDNFKKPRCPFCSQVCEYFVYDKLIFDMIQAFPEYKTRNITNVVLKNGEFSEWEVEEDEFEVESNEQQNSDPSNSEDSDLLQEQKKNN